MYRLIIITHIIEAVSHYVWRRLLTTTSTKVLLLFLILMVGVVQMLNFQLMVRHLIKMLRPVGIQLQITTDGLNSRLLTQLSR